MFASRQCCDVMPEVSRAVEYPVPGWDCELLPGGVPPNPHHQPGDDLSSIPENLVLLRCTSTTNSERQLDFLWDGRIVEQRE